MVSPAAKERVRKWAAIPMAFSSLGSRIFHLDTRLLVGQWCRRTNRKKPCLRRLNRPHRGHGTLALGPAYELLIAKGQQRAAGPRGLRLTSKRNDGFRSHGSLLWERSRPSLEAGPSNASEHGLRARFFRSRFLGWLLRQNCFGRTIQLQNGTDTNFPKALR